MSRVRGGPLSPRLLRLVAAGLHADERPLLAWLGAQLAGRLGVATVEDDPLPLERAWVDGAGRCSSNHLVDALIERDPVGRQGLEPVDWTLAVTSADLFAPGREFVFGEATLGGAWAAIGLSRMRAADDPEEDTLRRRALTEALHEIGHLAGLEHCAAARCAMAPAADAAALDEKESTYCPACRVAVVIALDRSPHGS